jgi:hypothetical protein
VQLSWLHGCASPEYARHALLHYAFATGTETMVTSDRQTLDTHCCLQASAAAFAKGLLDLEGTSLTPILVSLVSTNARLFCFHESTGLMPTLLFA